MAAGWAFIAGIAVFSGSLYALSLSQINILGAITPLGGVGLMVGWGNAWPTLRWRPQSNDETAALWQHKAGPAYHIPSRLRVI